MRAGNDASDGSIDIFSGDGSMFLRSGNGTFYFVDGATATNQATLSLGGTFIATDDLVAGGYEVHPGAPGSTRMARNPSFDDLSFARDEDQNDTDARFDVFTNIGVEQMRIYDGDQSPALVDGAVIANGLDCAEEFLISDRTGRAGEVVVFDPLDPGSAPAPTNPIRASWSE